MAGFDAIGIWEPSDSLWDPAAAAAMPCTNEIANTIGFAVGAGSVSAASAGTYIVNFRAELQTLQPGRFGPRILAGDAEIATSEISSEDMDHFQASHLHVELTGIAELSAGQAVHVESAVMAFTTPPTGPAVTYFDPRLTIVGSVAALPPPPPELPSLALGEDGNAVLRPRII